jgi:hypothetical protein
MARPAALDEAAQQRMDSAVWRRRCRTRPSGQAGALDVDLLALPVLRIVRGYPFTST